MQHLHLLVLRIRVANHQKRVPSEVPDVRRRNELVNFLIRRFCNAKSEGLLRLWTDRKLKEKRKQQFSTAIAIIFPVQSPFQSLYCIW
jgi:hypothetical protein